MEYIGKYLRSAKQADIAVKTKKNLIHEKTSQAEVSVSAGDLKLDGVFHISIL